MKNVKIPENYRSDKNLYETQLLIKEIKDFFQINLSNNLNLKRVSAPLFVENSSGLNDDLSGVEEPVKFTLPEANNASMEIVHSLAKWKRYALKRYGVKTGYGIYTDMNAIRRDEELDNLHSIYVDQWDWEAIITKENRNIEFLQHMVKKIYSVFLRTQEMLCKKIPNYKPFLTDEIHFITSQELLDLYPTLDPKEREKEIVKKYGSVFIMQIGDLLTNGKKHDGRAPDYDDWKLNGDIIVYNEVLDIAFELSSMGIRVDKTALKEQLAKAGITTLSKFHEMLLSDQLPLTIGGGIGQSRICMLFLKAAHIGEVQASIWTKDIEDDCEKAGINLL